MRADPKDYIRGGRLLALPMGVDVGYTHHTGEGSDDMCELLTSSGWPG